MINLTINKFNFTISHLSFDFFTPFYPTCEQIKHVRNQNIDLNVLIDTCRFISLNCIETICTRCRKHFLNLRFEEILFLDENFKLYFFILIRTIVNINDFTFLHILEHLIHKCRRFKARTVTRNSQQPLITVGYNRIFTFVS